LLNLLRRQPLEVRALWGAKILIPSIKKLPAEEAAWAPPW
jgi:hypothetical protein